jgi:2-hydroxychromene-2-carboxylate isomerase
MSIKSLLMPAITQQMLSRERLLKQRASAERVRISRGERHRVHYYHQVDDPYSALAAASLPQFVSRYEVELVPHSVGPPPDAAAPERDKLIAYSRKDAQWLARHWGRDFHDPGSQPSSAAVGRATGLLVAAIEDGRFVEAAGPVSACLWKDGASLDRIAVPGAELREAGTETVAAHLIASSALRERLGHYLGATFFYGGEWYWGIDRLHHLERRLQELGAARPRVQDLMFPPGTDLNEPVQVTDPAPIDFFFSLRSPYSAIVTPRVFELGRLTGAPVALRVADGHARPAGASAQAQVHRPRCGARSLRARDSLWTLERSGGATHRTRAGADPLCRTRRKGAGLSAVLHARRLGRGHRCGQ